MSGVIGVWYKAAIEEIFIIYRYNYEFGEHFVGDVMLLYLMSL